MATLTKAEQAQNDLDKIIEAKVQAQKELDATNSAKDTANAELAEIDVQIDEANTTLDEVSDEVNELNAKEQAELEKKANNPSADKYKARAKILNKKGKNGKALIGKGTGYEITLNK